MEHYIFYNDAGHGWLRVHISELEELGIASQISSFSYVNGKFAYLEEDLDAGVFLKAKFGETITNKELQDKGILTEQCTETSNIRNFDRYAA